MDKKMYKILGMLFNTPVIIGVLGLLCVLGGIFGLWSLYVQFWTCNAMWANTVAIGGVQETAVQACLAGITNSPAVIGEIPEMMFFLFFCFWFVATYLGYTIMDQLTTYVDHKYKEGTSSASTPEKAMAPASSTEKQEQEHR